MKKIFKLITALSLAVFVVLSMTACKEPLSKTTVSDEKTIANGQTTNGGTTLVYGDYLYFINGTQTNNGENARGVKQGAICRVKYDTLIGKVVEDAKPEIVVSDLVGFEDGSISIFGDFLYYTTPNNEVNYKGDKLCYKTDFKRYDLKNKQSHNIYTTKQNDSSETISYAYYVNDEDLYLMVYESVQKTLKSIKIGDEPKVKYTISNVETCVFSDNNGKSVVAGNVDANNYIFYTKSPSIEADGYDEGAKVFRVSPDKNDSTWLGNQATDQSVHNIVSILSIKNGKLIYTDESQITGKTAIYAQSIGVTSKLEFNETDIISWKAYSQTDDMILFNELDGGEVSIIAYNSTSFQIVYIEKGENEDGEIVPVPHTMMNYSAKTDIDFVGTTTATIVEKNDQGEVVKTDKIEYLLYTVTADNKVTLYKLEIKRNGQISASQNLEVVVADSDGMVAMNGLIMPETIGNNLFVMLDYENEDDKSEGVYLHMIDISKEVDDEDNKIEVIRKK